MKTIFTFKTPAGEFRIDLTKALTASLDQEACRKALKERLNRLNLKASDKGILWSIVDKTLKVGDVILRFGQSALAVILSIIERFPMTAAGFVAGMAVSLLLSAIPFLGWLLGPILGSLCMAVGVFTGLGYDLLAQIRALIAEMTRPLKECVS